MLRVTAFVLFVFALQPLSAALAAGPGPIPQWIWAERFPSPEQTVYLRQTFTVDAAVQSAKFEGLADDRMILFLNGKQVAEIAEAHLLQPIDVTQHLREGENVFALQATNDRGPAGALGRLTLEFADGRPPQQIVTDPTWRAALEEAPDWNLAAFDASRWKPAVDFGLIGAQPWGEPIGEVEDYNQWKHSLGPSGVPGDDALQALPGFEVELVRKAKPGEGSWISLAFDPQGGIVLAREDRGLLRLTLGPNVSELPLETIDDTLLECRGLLFTKRGLYANANNSKGLYLLPAQDRTGELGKPELLKSVPGNVGHGRNDLAGAVDSSLLAIFGNDTIVPQDYDAADSAYRNFQRDRLLPCDWNPRLFNAGVTPPAGHVIHTDEQAKSWRLAAGGLRNPYGVDLNGHNEVFTYDADMEWDAGAPWYRPTRVNHIIAGGEYGWRQGVDKWPAWFPDGLPTTLDIGLGSPTAVKFGHRSNFPGCYRDALYILDWAYGRIIAVHLLPRGASYAASAELVVVGRPLNVTDLDFGPDGAMYFTTGGRGTQSALYRLKHTGQGAELANSTPAGDTPETKAARKLRQSVGAFPKVNEADELKFAWPHLGSDDPWIRHAARVALERLPVEQWQARALEEAAPTAAATALMALARVGDPSLCDRVVARLLELPPGDWSTEQQLIILRAWQLCFIRLGTPEGPQAQQATRFLEKLYPSQHDETDHLLCELLVHLKSPHVVDRTLPLMETAQSQEQQLFFLFALRNASGPWTLEQRQRYLTVLRAGNDYLGGQTISQYVDYTKSDFLATLSEQEKTALASDVAALERPQPIAEETAPRPVVKEWQTSDLQPALARLPEGRDFAAGKRLFHAANCARCHLLGNEGQSIGPSLTSVSRRFSAADILESIVSPSKIIDDKYRQTAFLLADGRTAMGRVLERTDEHVTLLPDLLAPQTTTTLNVAEIDEESVSPVSPMPAGTLNTLTEQEVLDLLAYLLAAGDPRHPMYRAQASTTRE